MRPTILKAAAAGPLALALLAGGSALAADEPETPAALTPAFSGTIVSTYTSGKKAELWLNADHTYTAEGRKKDRSNGTWKLKGSDKICLRQSHPWAPPLSYCTAVPTGGVGSTWSAKSIFGDPLKVTLIAGRAGAKG